MADLASDIYDDIANVIPEDQIVGVDYKITGINSVGGISIKINRDYVQYMGGKFSPTKEEKTSAHAKSKESTFWEKVKFSSKTYADRNDLPYSNEEMISMIESVSSSLRNNFDIKKRKTYTCVFGMEVVYPFKDECSGKSPVHKTSALLSWSTTLVVVAITIAGVIVTSNFFPSERLRAFDNSTSIVEKVQEYVTTFGNMVGLKGGVTTTVLLFFPTIFTMLINTGHSPVQMTLFLLVSMYFYENYLIPNVTETATVTEPSSP